MLSRAGRFSILMLIALGSVAGAANAQDAPPLPGSQPIGHFVVDARAAFPNFKKDPNVAADLGVTTENLPGRTIGLVLGAHWYPVHMGKVTLGLGGELLSASKSQTLPPATEGGADGPTVRTHFSTLSPQVSFNFGKREGWSYFSGGIGWSAFTVELADAPPADEATRTKTINYGGGARWFSKDHVAFTVDMRFYAINPQLATATRPALPRMTLVILNAGVAFK
jgi:hypothetical protein